MSGYELPEEPEALRAVLYEKMHTTCTFPY